MRPRVLLFFAVLLSFGVSLTHGFHFDDYSLLPNPPWAVWQTRPLTWLSFQANAHLSPQPALWHTISITLHLTAVLLLFELLRSVLPEKVALVAAAIFAVHPLQAESVAYVFSRATLFSTVFSLGAALFWIRRKRWEAVACFALALLSKEDCASVPLVVLLFEGPNMKAKWRPWLAMVLLAVLAGLHSLSVTRSMGETGAGFTAGVAPAAYALHQGYVILRYLRLVVLPIGFTVDPAIEVSSTYAVLCWIVLALLAYWAWRRDRTVLAGLILLLPSSSVIPLRDLAADHRMYLPMTAFAASIAAWLQRLPRAVHVGVIVLLIGLSAQRMSIWSSDQSLWTEAVERAPDQLRPRLQLSRSVDPHRALIILQEAQRLHPQELSLHEEFGRVYLDLGQPAEAIREFGIVLGRNPRDPHALNNRGVALRALGQEDAAKQDFQRALSIQGCFNDARRNLGLQPCGSDH